ncbi:hypothetical protein SAMN04487843_105144 [Methylobacterium sp. ap11]|uniref:hypothetical protein n=1 Tax=Methylobacterium sp. ap11 TaxID=1761799 RepID=UPI0008D5CA38|nr:hypothetical protein [Methylobacterium sp. ap11]SEO94793.1 hypothetical protein SAMN04487843_105144 [Methylobacterium sp. ap11]
MTDTTQALHALAGEVAASGGRPAMQVARSMIARLDRAGLVIVPRDQSGAYAALADLDALLSLRDAAGDPEFVTEWAGQLGLDSPARLTSALVAVRDALDQGAAV